MGFSTTQLTMVRNMILLSACALSAGFMSPMVTHSRLASSKVASVQMSVVDDVMDKLKSMTLLEAAELVKAIEETFDVDASAGGGGGMMMMAPGAAAASFFWKAQQIEHDYKMRTKCK